MVEDGDAGPRLAPPGHRRIDADFREALDDPIAGPPATIPTR